MMIDITSVQSLISRTTLVAALMLAAPVTAQAGVCEAHFAFDGDLTDSSGNAYHGILIDSQNDPLGPGEFQPGVSGQAILLDGSSVVVAPLDLHWESCPKVTIALWARWNAPSDSTGHFVSTGYGAGPKLSHYPNRLRIEGGVALSNTEFSIEPGAWTPVVGTWDFESDEMTLHWPGGSLAEPFTEYSHPPQPEFWIGADGYFSALHNFANDVLIDDVRVWGRVLDSEEIAAVLAGNPPDVARCPCGPGSGAPAGPGPLSPGKETTPPADSGEGDPWIPELDPPPTLPEPGVTEPELTVLGDLPEIPTGEYDPEIYFEQAREENEQNFGPRDRAQVEIAQRFEVAYASVPEAFVSARGRIPALDQDLQNWLNSGKKIREIFRIKGTAAIVAVADDGTVAVRGNAQGKAGPVVNRIAQIQGNGRPIDLVADQMGDFVVISGTNVYSQGAPPGAVAWAQQELGAGLQVTALALLSGDAWIGVSRRGVASGGMAPGYWGHELLEDVRRFVDAGEVVQDISADSGSQSEKWAIATDKRIFIRGFDCRDYAVFGGAVKSQLSREWDCEVWQRHCLANRATWDVTDMSSDPDPDVWQVNLLVTIGVEKYEDEEKEEFDCWLEKELRRTELLFSDTPRLELKLRTQRKTRVDGVDLPTFVMDSGGKYARYMDRNFDIMAKSKTEGYYQVLVVSDICIGYNPDDTRDCAIGGMATFPHVVDPLTRKHGIIMKYPDSRDWVLAHEFGHYLSLIHTFESQGPPGAIACNGVYPFNRSNNQCNSCQGTINPTDETCDATYNVMDYCGGDNDDVRINSCQRQRAARQRERYLTSNGQTNYFKMKGRLGEAYCSNDSDCLSDEYCNTGVGTIGRNVCKSKLSRGSACTRGGQCSSGRCRVFKCR